MISIRPLKSYPVQLQQEYKAIMADGKVIMDFVYLFEFRNPISDAILPVPSSCDLSAFMVSETTYFWESSTWFAYPQNNFCGLQ